MSDNTFYDLNMSLSVQFVFLFVNIKNTLQKRTLTVVSYESLPDRTYMHREIIQ